MRVLIIFIVLINIISNIDNKLLFVNEHIRHGARGPVMGFQYGELDWLGEKWDTYGDLIPHGIRMLYLQGVKSRLKYKDFISSDFKTNEIVVYSTDLNRTIQSATSFLEGLYSTRKNPTVSLDDESMIYPPGKVTSELKSISRQLSNNILPNNALNVPIHVFQKHEHSFLLHDSWFVSDCEAIHDKKEALKNDDISKKAADRFINKYGKNLTEFIKDNNFKYELNKMSTVDIFCENFMSDYMARRKMGNLSKYITNFKEMYNDCEIIEQHLMEHIISGDYEIVMMSMTPPMSQIISWMNKRIDLDKQGKSDELNYSAPKYTLFSGHDTSLSTQQNWFKHIFKTKYIYPRVGSKITLELHKNEINNKYYVKYIVNDELFKEIEYDEFKWLATEKFWSIQQIYQFCKFTIIDKKIPFIYSNNFSVLVIVSFFVIISFGINIIMFYKNKHRKINTVQQGVELEEKII